LSLLRVIKIGFSPVQLFGKPLFANISLTNAIRFFIVIWLFKGAHEARSVSLIGPVAPNFWGNLADLYNGLCYTNNDDDYGVCQNILLSEWIRGWREGV
jgi:hypothetical protein